METKYRLLAFGNNSNYERIKKELDAINATYNLEKIGRIKGVEKFSLILLININDPLFKAVEKIAQKYKTLFEPGLYFSDEDYLIAERFYISAGEYQYPQPSEKEPDYRHVTYDLSNYCDICGMGKIQSHPFQLKSDFKQRQNQFLGLFGVYDEIFIRPEAKIILEKEGVTGIDFTHPILHKSNKPIKSVFQIRVQHILKPAVIADELKMITCKENNEEGIYQRKKEGRYCGRVKYYYPQTVPFKFKRGPFHDAPDFVKTYECFGSGLLAEKLIIVSRKFYDLIKNYKLKGLKFTPIILV